ncbi:MAG: hypothetical protein QM640_09530 [Niabella sp.]
MKKILIAMFVLFFGLTITPAAKAQVSVQVNIGSQPAWGPTGYDYAPYYYFPDYNIYFDVSSNKYIILNNNSWIYVSSVPARYRFDPYSAYKVVIKQSKPYRYNQTHIRAYAKYKGQGSKQPMIRDSKDEKYFESKQHPQHNQWEKTHSQQKNVKKQAKGNKK